MKIIRRVWAFVNRSRVESEIEEELQCHLEMRASDNLDDGMSPAQAVREARLRFGNPAAMKERVQAVDFALGLESLWADLRYALRGCLRNPGITLVAVLTLALGIGVNTTFFAAFDGIALKPLPVKDAQGLVRFEQWFQSGTTGDPQFLVSWPEYLYYRTHTRALSDLIAASRLISVVGIPEGATTASSITLQGQVVSDNYFPSLAGNAAAGRYFLPEESKPESVPAMVLSYPFWQRQFQGDPTAIGKTLKVNGQAFTIIGVAPKEFIGSGAPPLVPDFWAPAAMQAYLEPGHAWLEQPKDAQVQLLGRLNLTRADSTRSQAEAEMLLLAQQWGQSQQRTDKTIAVTLNRATFFGETNALWFRGVVAMLMGVIGLILLIACANLTNMLMARGTMRRHEIAVRRALGATRKRLLRQLLTESLVLGLLGGACGLLVSYWASHLLQVILQQLVQSLAVLGGAAFSINLAPDFRVFAYTLFLSLLTGVLFGMVPALRFSKSDGTSALKVEGATAGQQTSRSRLRNLLVAGQFAASLFLLISAGLLLQGLRRSLSVDPGFETKRVFFVGLNTGPQPSVEKQRQIMDELRAMPEVAGVAASIKPPGTGTFGRQAIIEGDKGAEVNVQGGLLGDIVSPDYFQTMQVPIVRGRIFTSQEAERGAGVAVVSASTARQFWPGQDPLGKRFRLDLKANNTWQEFEVVGVARDARNANLTRIDPVFFYVPEPPDQFAGSTLLIRVKGDPANSARAVVDALNTVDPKLQPNLVSLEDGHMRLQRLLSQMLGEFAGLLACLAVPLAGVGIYGVVAYLVSQRTREIGIRMALGATRGGVLRLILRQSMRPVAIGAGIGFVLSIAASSALHAFLVLPGVPDVLFGVSFLDPEVFLGLSLFLAAVALTASYIPARRAMRVDPMAALRYE
jgi:predicted permease